MKRLPIYLALFAALTAFGTGTAQTEEETATPPAEPWKRPGTVELNRELPRTQTICYNSEEAALGRSHEASQYLQPMGDGWEVKTNGQTVTYKHSYKLPFAWIDRELFVYIGSANAPYEVFVNGKFAGYNQSSLTAAEFNITEESEEGVNTLEIVVHGDAAPGILGKRDTEFKPAVTGETYILAQPRVRIRDYVSRIQVSEDGTAIIELGAILKSNMLNPKTLTIHYALYSPEGEVVTFGRRDREIDMKLEDTVHFVLNVPNAKLWSPEEPNLYTLVLKSQHEGRYWEYVPYRIGIRTVGVDKKELLVNGRNFSFRQADPYFLNDYSYSPGKAQSIRTDIAEIKARGHNTVAVTKPMPDWFYTLCDETGMLVINQADISTGDKYGDSRGVEGNPSNDPKWEAAYKDRIETMMFTSWHHPSVIAFSMAARSANGYNLYESYLYAKKITAKAGDGRPVIYENARGEWDTDAVSAEQASSKPETVAGRFALQKADKEPDPVTFTVKDSAKGLVAMKNNFYFRTVDTKVNYTVRQGKKKRVSRGIIDASLEPAGETTLTIPYGKAKPGKGPLRIELSAKIPDHGQKTSTTVTTTLPVDFR